MRSVTQITCGRVTLLGTLALTALAGCGSSTLETGYKPRPLNASDTERRAYYSSKYTKESVRLTRSARRNSAPAGPVYEIIAMPGVRRRRTALRDGGGVGGAFPSLSPVSFGWSFRSSPLLG